VYSHGINEGVDEGFDRDSNDDWDEGDEAEGSLGGLEATNNYGGEEVEKEEEKFIGDGWAERDAAARGEPYPAPNHDSRALMITLSAQNSSVYPTSFPKIVEIVAWYEPQLGVFEAARSNSSPTATWMRWRDFETGCTTGTRSRKKASWGC
jgi:hypothetical protein